MMISDGVTKCRECGIPVYMPGRSDCKSNHFDSTSPEGANCFPDNPIFEKLPQFDHPINIPSVFTLPGPTLLEVLKALRDTLAATNGRVPTAPLDVLISQYDFTNTIPEPETNEELKVDLSEVEHTWHNLYSDEPTFICKCGEEFETHEALMKHTAELNPTMKPEDFGRAGAGIERAAHENTLELLRRARDIIQNGGTDEEVGSLLGDIREQCPVLTENSDEPFEETGFGD